MNFDPKKQMSFQDLKDFFSATEEYQVKDDGDGYFRISLIDESPGETRVTSTAIYQPNLQRLLRKIADLHHNLMRGILD